MQVITGPSEITISCEVNHTQSLNHKRFDILVSRIQGNESQSFNSSFENVLEKFSRRGLSIENAVSTDSIFHYFEAIDIMNPGSYRISVRPSDGQSGDSMRRYFLRVRNTKAEDACPILLQQDPPLSYGTEGTRIRKLSSRIVGGNIASRNLVQYMAAIFMKSGSVCTGTLISSRWVLTAAHCNTTTESIVFILSTRLTRNGVRVGVSRVFSHPKYRMAENKVDYDIAVVELAVDVEQYGIKGMELNLNESIPTENYFVRTAGYGRTSFQRQNDTGTRTMARLELRQVDVPVTNFEYCKKRYNKFFREPSQMTKEHMFCLGYVGEGGCDTW